MNSSAGSASPRWLRRCTQNAACSGLGAQTGGRVVTPPHRKFKKNAPEWYEEMQERRCKEHSSRRIQVEHGIGHLKNWQ
ncbi:hypothetical protein [Streptomyces sp. SID9727]|uniref:hypothetical protein n=1 Tax=Streptomyces sp. SID9727 TaxID=2706114 RepID=UPI001EF2C045|nr:hypothetical protein [Streptomyces sp. SID9727]